MSVGDSDTAMRQEHQRVSSSARKQADVTQRKVAIVCDWLVGGGAERVVYELHQMFPDAPIYTSYATPEWRQKLDGKVSTGFLQYWPFSHLRKFIPFLRIWWFSRLKFDDYEVVISSSGAEAKGIRTAKGTLHIAYIHAPTHYYWSRYEEYRRSPGFGAFDWLARLGLRLLVGPLRRWDYRAAQRPDHLLANSAHIQSEIKKYYDRDSVVIHPPVDIERFASNEKVARHGFLVVGRQTPYKRIDLAVAACTQLGLPLTVIGNGPEHGRLVKMAGSSITFSTDISDADIVRYFQTAKAFIFPALDDFGIAPIEAMAAGTPVIAFHGGGALDYVIPGKTGTFFDAQNPDSLAHTLKNFKSADFNHKEIQLSARKFHSSNFRANFLRLLKTLP